MTTQGLCNTIGLAGLGWQEIRRAPSAPVLEHLRTCLHASEVPTRHRSPSCAGHTGPLRWRSGRTSAGLARRKAQSGRLKSEVQLSPWDLNIS